MKLEELLEKIKANNVPERWYAINDGVKPNAFIVFENYKKWECFCIDERGTRNDFTFFFTPDEAYDWLWEKIKFQLELLGRGLV
jgi:hypothetical protein